MIGEVALAIEMGADAVDIGKTIHPHPTLGESIGMAAKVGEGAGVDPDWATGWDETVQPAPDYELDPCVNW